MSAIFAIQVLSGKELHTKKEILCQMKEYGISAIKDVIAFEVFTKHFSGKEYAPTKARSIVPGYIFIDLDLPAKNCVYDMKSQAAEIWHFIKRIPFVQRILNYSIREEEFDRFFEIVSEHTDDFEVTVCETSAATESQSQAELLHKANTADNPKEKRNWLQMWMNQPSLLDHFYRVKQRATGLLNRLSATGSSKQLCQEDKVFLTSIKHSEAYIKRNNVRFRIPGRLFILTRNSIDPDHVLPNALLTTGSFIVPRILSYIEMNIRLIGRRMCTRVGSYG
ncbi:transcription termination/antitermination NusG family protein [Brevibacillus marinus]|uniref:transcription termination/antitermination NusG family protein n=1 Tax=Brevibacillus marinus TaxID=2496837 RepID=UPI0013E0B2AA|nr:transcription termination/antitermination NusG family protein [Brevibacillus marinus]